jgi:hypothetical protein
MASFSPVKTVGGATRHWWRRYRLELSVFLVGAVAMNLIFIANAFRESTTIDRTAAGQLGDFVGGYFGTFFALFGVVLVIRTIREGRETDRREKFEHKYFELIKMHRDNVAELQLQDATGRKIFVLLLRELRALLEVVREVAIQCKQELSRRQQLHVAYYCLFFGTGPNSSRMLRNSLTDFDPNFISELCSVLGRPEIKERAKAERQLAYTPFEGHQSRLGHYYRHLYQAISYVDQQLHDFDSFDKYEYVKTIRAQLSTHEQALLLVNSLTPIGQGWWRKELLTKYKLVKNMPRVFFDDKTELDTVELFPSRYFEWQEVEARRTESSNEVAGLPKPEDH